MLTRAKQQSAELPKRFYKTAEAGPVDTGFGVLLDGRPVRTPAGVRLVLPTLALAELVAEEWAAQVDVIAIPAMAANRLAFTAADHAAGAHEALARQVADFAASDQLCYFAHDQGALLEREIARWGPVLDWAERELGLTFVRATGVVHQPQPPETVERVRDLAAALDDFSLTALAHAAGLYGSAILALALQRGELGGEAAFDLSRLGEAFQEELWGIDDEAAARTALMRAEAVMLELWFSACSFSHGEKEGPTR